jgi:hypothetical protein
MVDEYGSCIAEVSSAILAQSYVAVHADYNLSLPAVDYRFLAPISLPATAVGMSTAPCAVYSAAVVHEDTAKKFRRLTDRWRSETGMLSRIDKRCMHPAYQRIIAMGERAIPFILQDLRDTRDAWFWALTVIAGEDTIPDDTPDDPDSLIEAWLSWGRANGYDV